MRGNKRMSGANVPVFPYVKSLPSFSWELFPTFRRWKVSSRAARSVDSVDSAALSADASQRRRAMSLGTILLIILIVLLVGALPTWPYSGAWGYYPSSGLGLVLVIVLILLLLGRI